MAETNQTQKQHSFETAMAELEKIVSEMESDKLPLERLIVAYEEGLQFVKICQARLRDAEKKIEILQRRAAEDPELRPFDPAAKTDAAPPAAPRKDVSLF